MTEDRVQRLTSEGLVPVVEAFVKIGPVASRSSILRWCTEGVPQLGEPIVLESVKVGKHRLTSEAAIRRFIARCTGLSASQNSTPPAFESPIA